MPEAVKTSFPDYIAFGLEEVARKQGFTDGLYHIECESGSNMGDGFTGELVKVFIREADRELVVLCKQLPQNEMRKQQGIHMFERESDAYLRIIPLLLEFQREKVLEKKVPRFDNVPRCYYAKTVVDKLETVIVMEDLRLQAFRMWDKAHPVNFEHARLLMVTLGRLHALSFAMKDQRPEQCANFREFIDPMSKVFEMDPTKAFERMMSSMCRRAIDTLEQHDTFRREKLEQLRDRCVQELLACTDATAAEPYAIIGHGDCWSNNMMFQYGEDNVTPCNIKLIDWQLSRYGSPVLDLVYFIFNCTDEEFRAHSYQRLLSIYYNSLSEHLHNLGGNVDELYPRSAFRDQLKRFGRYGFLMSLMVLPIICTPNDELPDTDETMEAMMKDLTNGTENEKGMVYGTTEKAAVRYRKRMSGAIRDVIRFGYI
uniref:CHK kinase-like domain-containing protein n=1 Tax=Anopheles atroparvus TaxID=41427 RepID=A0A182JA39_ANOAO